jgi:cytochrome P450
MTEIVLILALLAKTFEFRSMRDPIVVPWPSLTIYPRNGLRVRVSKRNG